MFLYGRRFAPVPSRSSFSPQCPSRARAFLLSALEARSPPRLESCFQLGNRHFCFSNSPVFLVDSYPGGLFFFPDVSLRFHFRVIEGARILTQYLWRRLVVPTCQRPTPFSLRNLFSRARGTLVLLPSTVFLSLPIEAMARIQHPSVGAGHEVPTKISIPFFLFSGHFPHFHSDSGRSSRLSDLFPNFRPCSANRAHFPLHPRLGSLRPPVPFRFPKPPFFRSHPDITSFRLLFFLHFCGVF